MLASYSIKRMTELGKRVEELDKHYWSSRHFQRICKFSGIVRRYSDFVIKQVSSGSYSARISRESLSVIITIESSDLQAGNFVPIVPSDANTRLVIFSARFCADCSARKLVRSFAIGRKIASLRGKPLSSCPVDDGCPISMVPDDNRWRYEFKMHCQSFYSRKCLSKTDGSINYARRRRGSSGRMDRRWPLFLESR